jgi:hypothetical protein
LLCHGCRGLSACDSPVQRSELICRQGRRDRVNEPDEARAVALDHFSADQRGHVFCRLEASIVGENNKTIGRDARVS